MIVSRSPADRSHEMTGANPTVVLTSMTGFMAVMVLTTFEIHQPSARTPLFPTLF